MIFPCLMLIFINLSHAIPTGFFSETIPIFLSDIPNQYSITQDQIYQRSKMTQTIQKDYFVKVHQKGAILPPIQIQNPLQPKVQTGISIDVNNDKKQGSEKNQISSRLVAIEFNQDKRIKFKATSSVSVKKISEQKIIGESSSIQQTPFQQIQSNNDGENEQKKPQDGNKQNIQYIFAGLLFLVILVIIFGFSDKKKQSLKPLTTVDVDEEHPESTQQIECQTEEIIEQDR